MSEHVTWQTRSVPATAVEAMANRHRLSPLAARVLASRGWQPGPALEAFLDPAGMPDPLALVGVRAGAERLWAAIDAGERITVCGDYDVDGITGAALLVAYLGGLGADVGCYLPHRYQDGYGLHAQVLHELAETGSKVLVTVDNGITSHAEIALAQALGMDVVLTDHHQPGETLPAAHTIINPRLMAEAGPFAPLAGVGVAYTLARGMEALRPRTGTVDPDTLLDLVAIGTIGDQAPLAGENRRLVKAGLRRIGAHPRAGLVALARIANVTLSEALTAEQVGLRLVPRLNAAGRMAHPRVALELLLSGSLEAAMPLGERLDQLNRERQRLTRATEARCLELLESGYDAAAPAIVLAEETWHHGVTGIVAGRLAERYRKPVVLFANDGEGWRGAGRCPKGYNLHSALTAVAPLLGRYGGHPYAVGCTLGRGHLEAFTRGFNAAIAGQLEASPSESSASWQVDAEVPIAELTVDNVEALACLQPTGAQNPAPTLALRDVRVLRQGVRGPEGQHLWLELADEGGRIEAIGFNMGHLHPVRERIHAIGVPSAEKRQGRPRLQLRLLALDASEH